MALNLLKMSAVLGGSIFRRSWFEKAENETGGEEEAPAIAQDCEGLAGSAKRFGSI